MWASDIGGVSGPASMPAQGPSPWRHRLPLLPASSLTAVGGNAGGCGERADSQPEPVIQATTGYILDLTRSAPEIQARAIGYE